MINPPSQPMSLSLEDKARCAVMIDYGCWSGRVAPPIKAILNKQTCEITWEFGGGHEPCTSEFRHLDAEHMEGSLEHLRTYCTLVREYPDFTIEISN